MKNFRNYALRLVSIRERSEMELRRRLKEKGADGSEIEEIIESFKEYGLIDDVSFAREFVKSKVERHWSWLRIKISLHREFGIDDETIETARKEYDREKVIHYYIDFFKRAKRPLEKIKAYLYRKGFNREFIKEVLESL